MMTEGRRKAEPLVRSIVMHERVPTTAAACERDLRLLARVTAEGYFAGVANWFLWGVGSWMSYTLSSYIRVAEKRSNLAFLRLVVEEQEETGVPWERIRDRSWVPLETSEVDPGYEPPEAFTQAGLALAERAYALAHPPSPRSELPADLPFDERWTRYVAALLATGARADWFFARRWTSEDRERFIERFRGLAVEVRAAIAADLSRHRRPSWRRLRRRLAMATVDD
jgi:hypothetical protein